MLSEIKFKWMSYGIISAKWHYLKLEIKSMYETWVTDAEGISSIWHCCHTESDFFGFCDMTSKLEKQVNVFFPSHFETDGSL